MTRTIKQIFKDPDTFHTMKRNPDYYECRYLLMNIESKIEEEVIPYIHTPKGKERYAELIELEAHLQNFMFNIRMWAAHEIYKQENPDDL